MMATSILQGFAGERVVEIAGNNYVVRVDADGVWLRHQGTSPWRLAEWVSVLGAGLERQMADGTPAAPRVIRARRGR